MPDLYDSATALLVVDVQNDFADPAGSLYVAGAEEIVDGVNREVRDASGRGALVVYTSDWHPPATPHFAKDGGVWPVHCVNGTWGARFHPAHELVEGAAFVHKGVGGEDGYSAFSVREPVSGARAETGLDEMLRERHIERLVVVGLATDYCVKETAFDAIAKGYGVTVLGGLVRAVDLHPGDGDRALEAVRIAGATLIEQ
jgi:nicotinamidase/pyrazinamidase